LEQTVIETVESGVMTKDLALCISGTPNVSRDKYVNTQEFIKKVSQNLKLKLIKIKPKL
jgi:isocitrate dehydrogenase